MQTHLDKIKAAHHAAPFNEQPAPRHDHFRIFTSDATLDTLDTELQRRLERTAVSPRRVKLSAGAISYALEGLSQYRECFAHVTLRREPDHTLIEVNTAPHGSTDVALVARWRGLVVDFIDSVLASVPQSAVRQLAAVLPPVEDPTDQRILKLVTDNPDLTDFEISQRLGNMNRQAVNGRRRTLQKMGYRVR